jgi:hypothetical protein
VGPIAVIATCRFNVSFYERRKRAVSDGGKHVERGREGRAQPCVRFAGVGKNEYIPAEAAAIQAETFFVLKIIITKFHVL